ncbi:pyridoxamine 5'-phosphate oxidase family protein [Streptomyces sp. NPDC059142]|uniref:pyridoxamine 5'-phosphate oxidase family protein n=1 Tax=Streptomyces sp. NPDC059142 TaxID=3346739 RepID=UPI00368DCC67
MLFLEINEATATIPRCGCSTNPSPEYYAFWQEPHLCTLTTLRPDGTPHVVPVGVTYDLEAGLARVITRKSSAKVSSISTAQSARVAVCQVHWGRWATMEGIALVRTDPELIADAVARYGERYGGTPAPGPERVVIEIELDRAIGQVSTT